MFWEKNEPIFRVVIQHSQTLHLRDWVPESLNNASFIGRVKLGVPHFFFFLSPTCLIRYQYLGSSFLSS
jgi:hypothetical protein